MTNNISSAFRSVFKKKQNNGIKIISLGVGLAMGLVLIAKVSFEQSFDNFYPHSERIYQIQENVASGNDKPNAYGQVSGGVAPGMKADLPQVEAATRITSLEDNAVFFTQDKKRLTGTFIMADSCLFDVLPRPMTYGNAKKVLSQPMYVLVSEKIAKNMGNNAVGQTIRLDSWPDQALTVGGIFKDVPKNTHLKYDVIVSMSSILHFFPWDGTQNWVGNDRYLGYVRLASNTDPKSMTPAINKMQTRHVDMNELKKAGVQLSYSLLQLKKIHSDDPATKRMSVLLALLAFALIFTAVLNYILIVLSSLVKRSKEIAIHKCYGAAEKNISGMVLTETFIHLVASVLLAALLIFLSRGTVEEILSAPLSALVSFRTCLLLVLVCVAVFFTSGIVPAQIFSKIPVSSAFRNFKESRRKWKLGLLFLQFIATAFLVTLLVIIGRQYNSMVNDNPGYIYENLLYCNTSGVTKAERLKAIEELRRIPSVRTVASCSTLPLFGASGNNVSEPGKDRELFNIADLYDADANYLSLMEIPLVAGTDFQDGSADSTQVIVSQTFAHKLTGMLNWKDGVVGKSIRISGHNISTIKGVYRDIRIGSISEPDMRPAALFYTDAPAENIMIKLHQLNSEGIRQVNKVLKNTLPNKDIVVTPYKTSMAFLYTSSRLFRNSVLIGGIITLIIVLIGLIGYTNDEINRRSAEIAIRKINGASAKEILQLFMKDILRIAIPALLVGELLAAVSAEKWMENFAQKTSLSLFIFLGCGIAVLAIILSVVSMNSYRIAIQNPVEAIKNE
ncbi:MAG TPA: ABC transporter permease [Paludibacter sp.]|nr:ABC transporter permease [Paludibacter sp.]